MRQLTWFGLMFGVFPALLCAGQVYGSLSEDGKGISGTPIEIDCGGAVTGGTTGGGGVYRVNVTQQGRCAFVVPRYPGRPTAVVFSYPSPAQYDFNLVRRPDGTYLLQKR